MGRLLTQGPGVVLLVTAVVLGVMKQSQAAPPGTPGVLLCPMDITQTTDSGKDSAAVDWASPRNIDMTGGSVELTASHWPGQTFYIGVTIVTYTATDLENNILQCSFQVEIIDEEKPTITGCPTVELLRETEPGQSYYLGPWDDGITIDDNSGSWTVDTTGPTQGQGMTEVGVHQVTYVATDAYGNNEECSFTVRVVDTEPPELSNCPTAIIKVVDVNGQSAVVTWDTLVITDNVGVDLGTLTGSRTSGDTFSFGGPTAVSFTVADVNGNTYFCTFTVTVSDAPLAVSNCPDDIQQPTDSGLDTAVVTWDPPDVEPVGASVTTESSVYGSGSSIPLGSHTINHTFTDGSDNTASCNFMVTVVDEEPPTWESCPSGASANPSIGAESASVSWPEPVAQDNSGNVAVSPGSHTSGDMFLVGTTDVTYTASDEAGNQIVCSFVVNIIDIVRPVLACPSQADIFTDPGKGTATIRWPNATATDNVAITSLVSNPPNGSPLPVGVNTITFTATDAAQNSDSCSFTITVIDTEPPEFSNCPTAIIKLVDVNGQSAVVTWDTLVITDNVGVDLGTLTGSRSSGDTFSFGGPTAVSITVNDVNGNTQVCSFTVTVSDAPLAVSNCPVYIKQPTNPGLDTAVVTWDPPDVEPVGTTYYTQSTPFGSGSMIPLGIHYITHSISDDNSNTASCVFVVEIVDEEPPTWIICPTGASANPAIGVESSAVSWPEPVAQDNSGIVVVSPGSHTIGGIFPVGSTNVTYTASDMARHVITCSFPVNVTDSVLPVLTCPSQISTSTDPGEGTATISWQDATATDNVAVTSLVWTPPNGSPLPVGVNTITYTATDAAQNSDSCSFTITVIDTEPPQFSNCPTAIIKLVDVNGQSAVVTWDMLMITDNVGVDDGTLTSSHDSGDTFTFGGPTAVSITVDDVNGNTKECSFTVTVSDAPLAVSNCPNDIQQPTDSGLATAVVTWDPPDVEPVGASVTTESSVYGSGSSIPLGSHTINHTITDGSDNTASCNFMVTVVDEEPPTWESCPSGASANPSIGAESAPVSWPEPVAQDNSGSVAVSPGSHTSGDMFPVGTTDVTYTASDEAGNEIICFFVVTVTDIVHPILTCPSQISTFTDPGKGTATISWQDATATDNVAVTSLVSNPPNGSPLPVGVNTITYTATDAAQNSDSCSFTITVIDDESPVIYDCPSTASAVAPAGQDMAIVAWDLPSVSDNAITVTIESSHQSGTMYPLGVTPVVYLVTDLAGNQATCSFNVNVVDQENPVFTTCPNDFTVSTAMDEIIASGVVWTLPVATDNDPQLTTTNNYDPPGDFTIGGTEVRYTAMDRAGNTAACIFTVTVIESQVPPSIINCPGNINHYVAPGLSQANVQWNSPTALPSSATLTTDHEPGSVFNAGTSVTVTYTVTDVFSQTSHCTFAVTVIVDVENPAIQNCPVNIMRMVPQGETSLDVSWTPPVVSDNSGQATLTPSHNPGDSFMIQTTPVTYAATDPFGHSSVCTFTVTITVSTDTTPPVIFNCPSDISMVTDISLATASVSWTEPTATDDSGVPVLASSISPGFDFPIGTAAVTYTATDGNNNQQTCSFTVTVTEVCVDEYCQNGGTCVPSSVVYLSSCICPSGHDGDRCEGGTVMGTDPPSSDSGLSTEAIIGIVIGVIILVIVIFLVILCMYFLMIPMRKDRQGYLYNDENEGKSSARPRIYQPPSTMNDVQLEPRDRDNNGFQPPTSYFSVPYVASGREAEDVNNGFQPSSSHFIASGREAEILNNGFQPSSSHNVTSGGQPGMVLNPVRGKAIGNAFFY